MSEAKVAVVGGGLAGLAAALDCQRAGLATTLLEARPRLGGATWSTQRNGLWVDNGQHVFLRCCVAYREFLDELGVSDQVTLQPRLALPVRSPTAGTAWLRAQPLPPPLHLAGSLLRFRHLPFLERIRAARIVRRLGTLDLEDAALDTRSFGSWLEAQGAAPEHVDRFWDLLIRPTVNTPARDASLALATRVYQTGLLEGAGNADIGWSTVPLQALHADPAAAKLRARGAEIRLRAPVQSIEAGGSRQLRLRVADGWLEVDAVVLAVPHEQAAALLPRDSGVDAADVLKLGRSAIVNLHAVFDRQVMETPLLAGIDTPLEWVFDRSDSSGLEQGQYLAITLSAADRYLGRPLRELRGQFLPALAELLPPIRNARLLHFFSTVERAATFHQVAGSAARRPGTRTRCRGLYLAGAWTNTGWPATMEGAVRSGRDAAGAALDDLGIAQRGTIGSRERGDAFSTGEGRSGR